MLLNMMRYEIWFYNKNINNNLICKYNFLSTWYQILTCISKKRNMKNLRTKNLTEKILLKKNSQWNLNFTLEKIIWDTYTCVMTDPLWSHINSNHITFLMKWFSTETIIMKWFLYIFVYTKISYEVDTEYDKWF